MAGAEPRAGVYPAPLLGWAGLLRGDVEVDTVPDQLRGMLAEPAVRALRQRQRQRTRVERVPAKVEMHRPPLSRACGRRRNLSPDVP